MIQKLKSKHYKSCIFLVSFKSYSEWFGKAATAKMRPRFNLLQNWKAVQISHVCGVLQDLMLGFQSGWSRSIDKSFFSIYICSFLVLKAHFPTHYDWVSNLYFRITFAVCFFTFMAWLLYRRSPLSAVARCFEWMCLMKSSFLLLWNRFLDRERIFFVQWTCTRRGKYKI